MISKNLRVRMRRWSAPSAVRPPPPPRPEIPYFIPESERAALIATPSTSDEVVVRAGRRSRKAERDERMDITRMLTPPKTYEGGFQKPSNIRTTHWQPGGYYATSGKEHATPALDAYEPHTVLLLESRYPIQHSDGRVQHEHIVGVCKEQELSSVLAKYNSLEAPGKALDYMDKASWPFQGRRSSKPVRWWNEGENPAEILTEALDAETGTPFVSTSSQPSSLSRRQVPVELLPHNLSATSGAQRRAYHRSAARRASDTSKPSSTTAEERASIPTSSWARPPKPSQDADDNVVPVYYIERKRQRDTIAERKEEEGGLMAELSAGILSEGVAAQTKVLPEKIPVEVKMPDGTVVHPSGFEPPTPETDFHPVASKVATEEDPLLTTVKVTWDEALSPSPETLEATASDTAASAASSSSKLARSFHSSAVARASEVPHVPLGMAPSPPSNATSAISANTLRLRRKRYLPTLVESPFWRPLLSLTFTTRPIAHSIARLSRGMERGTPFYTFIPVEDRKHCASFSSRLRTLRISRMQRLTSQLTRSLLGDRGGLPGVRFDASQKGRGVDGEGLDKPIEQVHRRVKVGVAEWHLLSEEVREAFAMDARENEAADVFEVFGIDENGKKVQEEVKA